MSRKNGSSSYEMRARFTPLDPDQEIRILLQPAEGGKNRNHQIIRPQNGVPYVRTPLRIKHFGSIHACLLGLGHTILPDARKVNWKPQVWLVQGWWFDLQRIVNSVEVTSGSDSTKRPMLLLSKVEGGATHNVPINENGNVVFPEATFGK